MRLLVINPNTTRAMTAKIATAARRVARPGTEIIATQPDIGPESIQGFLDVARSQQGLLEVARRHPDVDAVVWPVSTTPASMRCAVSLTGR